MMRYEYTEESMKKLLEMGIVLMLLVTLLGCISQTTTSTNTTSTSTNTTTTSTISTTNWVDNRDEVQTAMVHYQQEIDTIAGEPIEEMASRQKGKTLGSTYTEYPRSSLSDLPIPDSTEINAEWMQIASMIMADLLQLLPACIELNEDGFCSGVLEETFFYVRFQLSETELSIESYRSSTTMISDIPFSFVSADILRFNEIADVLTFDYVRENKEWRGSVLTENIYFDSFQENGNVVNVALNPQDPSLLYYQTHNQSLNQVFLVSTFENHFAVNYADGVENRFYSALFDQSLLPLSQFVGFGIYNAPLTCQWDAGVDPTLQLSWNLHTVAGWDRLLVSPLDPALLYQGQTRVLEEYAIHTELFLPYAILRLTQNTTVSQFNAEMLALAGSGAVFDELTYDEVMSGLAFMEENLATLLVQYGFTADLADGYAYLLAKWPFTADSAILSERYDLLFI